MVVSFLRGINVGANNKISMSVLKSIYTKLGYVHIKTYLNSGNVVFKSFRNKTSALLEKEIKNMIKHQTDLDIEVIIRTKDELQKIVNQYPFLENEKNRYVTMLKVESNKNIDDEIQQELKEDDKYLLKAKEVYLYLPDGYGRTKINNKFIEKHSETVATTRNLNTLIKVLSMMQQ